MTGPGHRPAAVRWVLHHGPWSYPEDVGPETWTSVHLAWDAGRYHDDIETHELITDPEQLQALRGMRPVLQVLEEMPSAPLAS
jgi:hypothetical protein